MKNYLRIFAFMLAAVFAFTACDSSGGGGEEEQQPESVSYSGRTDGKLVKLTLTASGAASKTSGGQRVPGAFTGGGTYTLHVDNVLVSSGTFTASGDTLNFTSTAGNPFSAKAEGNTPPVFSADIPLDTTVGGSSTLTKPELVNTESFEMQVYNPDGSTFTDTVTLYGVLSDNDEHEEDKPIGEIGKITGGFLTLNLRALKDNELFIDYPYAALCFTDAAGKAIALSLQGAQKREEFSITYFTELLEEDGRVYEKGWVYTVEGDAMEGGEPHTLKWFTDRGYTWVYRANPLQGTWTTPSGSDFSGTLTFAGNSYTWTTDRGFSSTGTFEDKGNNSIGFFPNGGEPWIQEFTLGGNGLRMRIFDDNEWGRRRGGYLRQ